MSAAGHVRESLRGYPHLRSRSCRRNTQFSHKSVDWNLTCLLFDLSEGNDRCPSWRLGSCFDGSIKSGTPSRMQFTQSIIGNSARTDNLQIQAYTKGVSNEFSSEICASFSRVLMAIVFLLNGLGIINQAGAAKELLEHGAPTSLVPLLMLSARTIEIVAGFSLALGIYPRLAAVTILAFLFPATFTAHAFWQVSGSAAFTPQLLNFFKNAAMMGGLLFIAATRSQPTLLPRTARPDGRRWIRNEATSRGIAPAS